MKMLRTMAVIAAMTVAVVGCDKKGDAPAPTGSVTPKAGAASAAPASNLPTKGPWEAVKITTLDKKEADGSPVFKIENLGGKQVETLFLDFYGYDAKGKQVAHEESSFNIPVKAGGSVETSTKPIKDATTWEAVYHGIKFAGDAQSTMDYKRAPATRAKGS